MYSQFNLTIPSDQVQSRNVAVVMVSASLPSFAREGDTLDDGQFGWRCSQSSGGHVVDDSA